MHPPPKLWQDFEHNFLGDHLDNLSHTDAKNAALLETDLKLQLHGKSIEKVNLPKATHRETDYERVNNAFNRPKQALFAQNHPELLTSEQRAIHTTVIDTINNKGRPFMIDAPAGTGKTFVEKVIAANLRGIGNTVLIIASTAIAALQLLRRRLDRLFHVKLPLDDQFKPCAVCNIRSETQRADLIWKCDLLIWDVLPMAHRPCVEALDRTLRDLLRVDTLFGGNIVFFNGDWRQIGSKVKFGPPADTADAAVISSSTWP